MFSFLASEEQGNSKRVVHPPSQALCTYNPLITVKRLKHENPQCQIEWKLQLKQQYLNDVIWNACCRLLLRKALKPLIWTGPSVFSSKPSGSFDKLQFWHKIRENFNLKHTLLFFGEVLKRSIGKEKDDDHDQDYLKKTFWHIWSWSSAKLFLERKRRWPWPRFPQERLATHMVMVLC